MHVTPGACLHVPSLSSRSLLVHCFENTSEKPYCLAGRGTLRSEVLNGHGNPTEGAQMLQPSNWDLCLSGKS